MDRRSFINNKYLNEISSGICGTDDCECDETSLAKEKHVLKETQSFGFAALSVMALICTILFAGYKINAAKVKADQWLLVKNDAVISCSADRLGVSGDGSMNDKDPGGNGNSCSHQQIVNSLCETTNSKRRVFKIHTC